MVRLIRTVITWLVLLALPLQGYAAATLLHCGPDHHRMSQAAELATSDSADHVIHSGHRHASGTDDAGAMKASVDAGDDAASLHHLDKLSKFRCSACAACCMGAALPTAVLEFNPVAGTAAPTSFVTTARVGFVTDNPERPPRLHLA